jgi:signal transduction histidine kinase
MLQTENSVVVYYLAGSVLLLLLIMTIIIYAFLHQKKVIELKVRLHEEDIRAQQAVFDALQEGQEKERARLAEELHDGIGAKLSGLKMSTEYLKINASEHEQLISRIFTGLAETLEEVRVISHNLQPYFFRNKDLEQLLLNYMEQLSSLNGCRYELFMDSPVTDINDNTKLYCYRIIAELLHNIHKHAKASFASVQINVEDDKMEILVEDNGVGFNSNDSDKHGIGLQNIQNRIKVCKGKINIDSSDKGTSVIIEIPLNSLS